MQHVLAFKIAAKKNLTGNKEGFADGVSTLPLTKGAT